MIIHNFWVFAFASLMLNITPGNDMLFVASRSTSHGSKAGIISALGVAAGCLVHLLAAAAGLSAIITQSAFAFNLIKYLGAAYLVYLGAKSFFSKSNSFKPIKTDEPLHYKNIFLQGALTNVLNPKVALFFLAFLPQFINPANPHPQLQILVLGFWFDFSGTVVNVVVALLFGRLGNWFVNSSFIKWQQKITGTILIALGIKVAFSRH